MSGASKRLQEANHPTASKRSLDETGRLCSHSGLLLQSATNDFHLQIEHGQDGRLAKIQRIEPPHFVDRISPLMYRTPSSSKSSCLDPIITFENRQKLKDINGFRDFRTEKRETKIKTRELHTELRGDPLGSKADTDTRPDSRVDEKGRDDRESHSKFEGGAKLEKDTYGAPNFQLNLKELKEHHMSKRCSESPSDNLDACCISRHGLHSTNEVENVFSAAEEQNSLEALEAVGQNKVNYTGEDELRDTDRERKDEKLKDYGEREKERNGLRNNLLLGCPSNEYMEMVKEHGVLNKLERERKDDQKDKEQKSCEEPSKTESPNTNERENLHSDKELVNEFIKSPEQEGVTFESKGFRNDSWKAPGKELKDKKREREIYLEGDMSERLNKCYDKESNDGCAGDGVTERDTESYEYSDHQRRRMLRSRVALQTPPREPCFQSGTWNNEGSQDMFDIPAVVYKEGSCMQELLKTWREFEASQVGKNEETLQNGPTLEIIIPAEFVTATNRQVRGAQLWGTDTYTNDSDLVAVLMHSGYCRPTSSPPPSSISELRATIRVLPPQECYTSTLRNNVRSRAWGAGIECSFRVEKCCIVKKCGGTIDLEHHLTHILAVEPTLAPESAEQTMTTRSTALNPLHQRRCVREFTIQYNLCNEPWLKYSISIVADRGLKKPLYTAARLKKGEVLYLETHFSRYELCFTGEKAVSKGTNPTSSHAPESNLEILDNHSLHVQTCDRNLADHENIIDVFRWSRCKKPLLPQAVMLSIKIPLPTEHLEILEENLDWEDIKWSQNGVWVAGKEYVLARIHFLSPN